MDQYEHVTITVDDDACLRILSSVAERCGGSVKLAVVTRLELTLPNAPRSRSDRRTGGTPKAAEALPIRG